MPGPNRIGARHILDRFNCRDQRRADFAIRNGLRVRSRPPSFGWELSTICTACRPIEDWTERTETSMQILSGEGTAFSDLCRGVANIAENPTVFAAAYSRRLNLWPRFVRIWCYQISQSNYAGLAALGVLRGPLCISFPWASLFLILGAAEVLASLDNRWRRHSGFAPQYRFVPIWCLGLHLVISAVTQALRARQGLSTPPNCDRWPATLALSASTVVLF